VRQTPPGIDGSAADAYPAQHAYAETVAHDLLSHIAIGAGDASHAAFLL
jgi:hypothetical protein